MGRKPRQIEGVISDVIRRPEEHKGQFRLRFKLNGVAAEAYRAKREDADALHRELESRAILKDTRERTAITWLSAEQLRQAHLAYQILANNRIIDLNDDNGASMLAISAEKFAAAVKAQGPAITVASAYEQFMARQANAAKRSKKTLLDYDRYVLKGFVATHGAQAVYQITPEDCNGFVMGYTSNLDRFKSYTYLHAFLNFCTGKKNPAIDPLKGKPWIARNPMNFDKPVCELKDIESYTLNDVQKILVKAHETGSLGYIVFRLFGLCRFEEFHRLVSLGGGSRWDTNKFIDLPNNRIIFNGQVYQKKSNGQRRGRTLEIHKTFRVWIDFCLGKGLGFTYNRLKDENARKAVPEKFGRDSGHNNLLRHTAITFHVKAFGKASDTAYMAGTSTEKIDSNYYNARVKISDARGFYQLTPKKLGLK